MISTAVLSRWQTWSKHSAVWTTVLYAVVFAVYAAFVVSTVPGVRPHAGYNLLLDGFLNNIAYELSAVVCFVRARNAPARTAAAGRTCSASAWRSTAPATSTGPSSSGRRTRSRSRRSADALWLSFYPFAFIALLLIVREIAEDVPLSLWLDGVVGGLAVAGVAAAFFGPILAVTGGSKAAVVTTLAYPLLDVLLLLVVTAVLALFHWRPPVGLWLLVGGLVLFAVADAVYLFSAANGTYQPGGLNDAVWVLATLVIGFAPGRSKQAAGVPLPDVGAARLPGRGDAVRARRAGLRPRAHAEPARRRPVRRHRRLRAGPADRHLPRGELAGRQPPAGPHRRADRPGQPARPSTSSRPAAAGPRAAPAVRCCCSTSTGSRRSTTASGTTPETTCCGWWPPGCARTCTATQRGARPAGRRRVRGPAGRRRRRADAERWRSGIREVLEPPFTVDGVTVRVNASIGISLFPEQGVEVSALLRRADIAMYQAKASRSRLLRLHAEQRLAARPAPACATSRSCATAIFSRAPRRALPAEGRRPHARGHRCRGAGALAAPDPRPAAARRVPAAGRGLRPDAGPDRRGSRAVTRPGAHLARRRARCSAWP